MSQPQQLHTYKDLPALCACHTYCLHNMHITVRMRALTKQLNLFCCKIYLTKSEQNCVQFIERVPCARSDREQATLQSTRSHRQTVYLMLY